MAKLAPPPPTNQDVASRQFRDWFYSVFQFINQQTGTLGTMAYENANSVAITGGSIGGVGISGSTVNSTPIGTITPSTGNFTDLSSSGTVSGTGFTNYLASPPPIGSITPNSGKFTSLQTTGTTIIQALSGYLKGTSGTVSAVSSIPYSDISGTPTLGSMASQNANNVSITGGSINGTTIGATTATTGKFTDLQATGTTTLGTLNGYLKATTGVVSASSTIPYTDITGLATVAHTGAYSDLTGTPTGVSVTITTAKLTTLGTNGSMTFTNGILTSQTQAT